MLGIRIEILRIAGIPIRIDLSWVAIAVLITWSLAAHYFPAQYENLPPTTAWLMGGAGAIGLFVSILLHELAHSVVALRFGVGIRSITLFLFGGVAEMEREPPSPAAEFLIAIAGPLMSFALAGGCVLLLAPFGWVAAPVSIVGVFVYVGWMNGLLATFNLIPAFPLDGGRVLRSILWKLGGSIRKATKVTSAIGTAFGLMLGATGLLLIVVGATFNGLWLGLLGLFVINAARSSYRQLMIQELLAGETVRRFMSAQPVSVPREISLRRFVDEFVYGHQHKVFPVLDGQQLLGVVNAGRLREIPRDEWERQTVGSIVEPLTSINSISPESDALAALLQMSKHRQSRLLVVQGELLVGVLSLKDLTELLSMKLELEETPR